MTGTTPASRGVQRLLAALTLALLALLTGATLAAAATTAPGATDDPTAPAESAESIRVLVRNGPDPVPDVDFTITAGGDEVASGSTGEDGQAVVGVPEPGDYEIEIDTGTLPDGTNLRNPERNPATTTVNPLQTKPVAFPIVTGDAPVVVAGGSSGLGLSDLPQLISNGVRFGLILALAAIGLSVIFGTTGLTNFAHGELVTFGAMMAYLFNVTIGLPLIVAGILAVVSGGLFGLVQDRVLWQPLRNRSTGLIAMMIVSIGLGLAIRYTLGLSNLFGTGPLSYADYRGQAGLDFGSFLLRPVDLWSMGLAIVVLVGVVIALRTTRLGKATRAVADNPALAAATGINVDQVIRVVWITGSALAALSGILLGISQGMNYQLGFQILLLVFAAVTLGGLGTAAGAILGSFVIGLFIELSPLVVDPELKYVGALLVLIIVLLVRPQGILGRRERIG